MSIADEMSKHAFITQLIIQIRERVRVTSPRLHSSQAVACLIGSSHFEGSTKTQAWRAAHQDLSNCSDEVQSWVLLLVPISFPTKYQIIPFFPFFSVSRLGSEWLVCRRYVIHMHLWVIHYEYGIANQSCLYAQGYIYIYVVLIMIVRQHVDYEHCEFL